MSSDDITITHCLTSGNDDKVNRNTIDAGKTKNKVTNKKVTDSSIVIPKIAT